MGHFFFCSHVATVPGCCLLCTFMRTSQSRNVFTSCNVYAFIVSQKPYYVKRFSSSAHFPTSHRQAGSRIQASNVVECGYSRFRGTQRALSWPVHEMDRSCFPHILL